MLPSFECLLCSWRNFSRILIIVLGHNIFVFNCNGIEDEIGSLFFIWNVLEK